MGTDLEVAGDGIVHPQSRLRLPTGSGLGGVVLAAGAVYALAVPLGLPYDEPSHWDYARYVASHWALPVLGEPGTTYEAQQGPVAYVVYAVPIRCAEFLGAGLTGQHYVARLVGVLWLAATVMLATRLVTRILPSAPRSAVLAGVAVTYATPIMLAVGGSVQNDLAAVTLALAATPLYAEDRPAWAVGALSGLAMLAKVTTWPVGVVLAAATWRQHGLRAAGTHTASATAILGWWLIRNLALYGDATGASAVGRTGVSFQPIGWSGPSTIVELARTAVTFLWIPVEYHRNTVHAAPWVEGIVGISTIAIALGLISACRRGRRPVAVVAAIAAVSVVAWAVLHVAVQTAGFRIAYQGLPLWAVGATMLFARIGRPLAHVAAATSVLVVLHLWYLLAIM